MPVTGAYREDLASIHDAGFGEFALHAGRFVVDQLARSGAPRGEVVDLGCGSGITARVLRDAGYGVTGIDLSAALVERARRRVPDATFRVGSFVTEPVPDCVAVTAIGEVFGYAFDTANCERVRADVFERIHRALAPGGLLVFDVATPQRAPRDGPVRSFTEGEGWAVLVQAHSDDARRVLTRHITTFRRVGELYRRDTETHVQHLIVPEDVVDVLERIGFQVHGLASYGALPLLPGVAGFVARKRT